MRLQRGLIITAVLTTMAMPVAAAGTAGSLTGAAAAPVAIWEMNEPRGATTLLDSSGNGRDGQVGTLVKTGISNDTGSGYRWPWARPNTPPAQPERLVAIGDDTGLDPGDDVYSISFRFKTHVSFGNYLQKGQATTAGGQIKVQAPKGVVNCMFKGSAGRSSIGSKTPLNDNLWHVVTCRRDAAGVTMYVDGEFRSRNRKPSGHIDNSYPFTIGGKPNCDQVKVTCDYFVGEMDWVRVDRG